MPEQAQQAQTQTIQIYPVAHEVLSEWTIPALQAYYNSPNWQPVVLRDAIVYVWPMGIAEALVVPSNPVTGAKSKLYYITRRSRKILLFLVDTHIPGGRSSNLYNPPVILDQFFLHQFIAAFLFSAVFDLVDNIEKISAYCSPTSGDAVACKKDGDIFYVSYCEHELRVIITRGDP